LNAKYGPFDLDPCATADNAKCPRYFTKEQDGLSQEWTGRVFMNPPYGRTLAAWMRKAWEASQTTAEVVVCLVPGRIDTAWWHDYALRGEVTPRRGRLKFGACKNSAPFRQRATRERHKQNRRWAKLATSPAPLTEGSGHET
jgi:site-specific DNA-methyltransferase (adenine-specific)